MTDTSNTVPAGSTPASGGTVATPQQSGGNTGGTQRAFLSFGKG